MNIYTLTALSLLMFGACKSTPYADRPTDNNKGVDSPTVEHQNPEARKFATDSKLKGSVDVLQNEWVVTLHIDGAKFAFRVPPFDPTALLSDDELFEEEETEYDLVNVKHETRVLRIDLGAVEGNSVWLLLAADGTASLVVETRGGTHIEEVTDRLLNLPLTSLIEDAPANGLKVETDGNERTWEAGTWAPRTGDWKGTCGELIVRPVDGGVELVDKNGNVKLAPNRQASLPSGSEDCGDFNWTLSCVTRENHLHSIEWVYETRENCNAEEMDWLASDQQIWRAKKDGSFELRWSKPTDSETHLGDEIEWSVVFQKNDNTHREVFEPNGCEDDFSCDCGRRIRSEDREATWKVRARGGTWQTLGTTRRLRYDETGCEDEIQPDAM